jgi:AcrR family transcriptional regulator
MDTQGQQAATTPPGRSRRGTPEQTADGPGTRARIQTVALELFTEQGYEKTSLREIAERLGVTKAALYYHFPTKDDIINSLIEDRIQRLDELLEWARAQPRTPDTRRELIRRYCCDLEAERHDDVMRFFERNQTAIKAMPAGVRMRERLMSIVDAFSEPDDPPARRLRHSLAIFALHTSWFMLRDPALSDADRRAAALEVAYELVSDAGAGAADPPGTTATR